jgi:GNAT superfamily N-acetyltransferase
VLDVRDATPDDLPAIGRVLAAAFADDPVWTWITSPRTDWSRRAAAWFSAVARLQLKGHGTVLVDEGLRGAAIWTPPGRWKGTLGDAATMSIPSARLFGTRLPRALHALATNERIHPTDPPHWYLELLGTDPAHQGTGVGSALIAEITDRCDREGLDGYLESSKEQNLAFYARHGFEVREEVHVTRTSPTTWTMWRAPLG